MYPTLRLYYVLVLGFRGSPSFEPRKDRGRTIGIPVSHSSIDKRRSGTYRKQSVTADLICQWYDCRKVGDVPAVRGEDAQVDHSGHQDNNDDIHPLEVPHNAVQPNPKPAGLEFFGRGRPLHVDAEEMAQDRFEEVVGDAAEEQQKEGRPLDCFPEASEEGLLTKTVA
jgi:hypothetical protein